MTDPDELKDRLGGAITALVTPLSGGEIDYKAFDALIEWQIEAGIGGLAVGGATGEAPTLSREERLAVIRRCVQVAGRRVPVIAGTGTNDTKFTIAFTSAVAALGADAALVVTPYYSKPTQEGIFGHFEAVARNADLPVIVDNAPARTGIDLKPETVERLALRPGIVGIRDATGDMTRPVELARSVGWGFLQFSGHDPTSLAFDMLGGHGAISAVSNLFPEILVERAQACRRGDAARALHLDEQLRPVLKALELESDPVPVKYALHMLRGMSDEVRLPLVRASAETVLAVRSALSGFLAGRTRRRDGWTIAV